MFRRLVSREGYLGMLNINHVLGSRLEPAFSERIHRLEHHNAVDIVELSAADLERQQLSTITRGGEELEIALPRHQKLFDGAVLLLDDIHAIVVRAANRRWLRLEPRSLSDAIELGYHVGNLHWRGRLQRQAALGGVEGRPGENCALVWRPVLAGPVGVERLLEEN